MNTFSLEGNTSDVLLIEENSTSKIAVECKHCDSTGFIRMKTDSKVKRCPHCKDERVLAVRRARMSNIPKHLQRFPIQFDVDVSMTIFDPEGNEIKKITEKKAIEERFNKKIFPLLDKGSSYLIFGNKGSGKTMVACGVAVKSIEDGKRCVFCMSNEIGDASFKYSSNPEAYRELFTSDLLIIDNLGSEFVDSKDFRASFIVKILTARTTQQKPTIITSCLNDLNSIKKTYGKKVFDIISSHFVAVRLTTNKDYSLNLAKKASLEFAA